MATLEGIDHQNNSNEAAKESVSETTPNAPKPKLSPPPFIIYSETNEEFVLDDELGLVGNFESGVATETAETKKTKRRNRRNRNKNKKGLREELKNKESLVLPDGVTLVENGSYIGFHCTYCNCVMSSLKTVEEHAGGNPHKQKLRSKAAKGEDEAVISAPEKSTPPLIPKADVSLPSAPNRETMASLSKSTLNKFLLKTKEPIVGLDHIVEVQLPDVPSTYRCNLCLIDCDSEGIKEHIIGTRHRLSYLRLMDTQKVAEMLALNLKKPERNKRTIKYTEELETMYGPGTVQVTDTPLPPITIAVETETKSPAQPQVEPPCESQDNQSVIQGTVQKRPSDEGYPPWKRQSTERGFQTRKRYNSRRQQGSYFDRRQSTSNERELNYPIQHQEGIPMNTEKCGSDQPFDKEHHLPFEVNLEQNLNKPSERSNQQIDNETNKEKDINTSFGRHEERTNRGSNREHWDNRPYEKHDQHVNREANRGSGESWRSYSDDPRNVTTFNMPQSDHHTASPSKHEQQLVTENPPSSKGFKNNASNVVNPTGYESTNMQCSVPPPPLPPPFISNFQDAGDQSSWRGRGRRGRFNNRNRGSSFSRSATNRFSTPSRFETNRSSGFGGFGDFGRLTSFRSLLSDPLSNERDRLKMKYPGLRLGR